MHERRQRLLHLTVTHLEIRLREPDGDIGRRHALVGPEQILIPPPVRTLLLGGACGCQIVQQGRLAVVDMADEALLRALPVPLGQLDKPFRKRLARAHRAAMAIPGARASR